MIEKRMPEGLLGQPSTLFGNRKRTSILVAIRLLEETYAAELAAMLGIGLSTVQTVVGSLDRESVLSTREMGRTRLVKLNPRYPAGEELSALLWKLGEADIPLQQALASRRRRPRRIGKGGLI